MVLSEPHPSRDSGENSTHRGAWHPRAPDKYWALEGSGNTSPAGRQRSPLPKQCLRPSERVCSSFSHASPTSNEPRLLLVSPLPLPGPGTRGDSRTVRSGLLPCPPAARPGDGAVVGGRPGCALAVVCWSRLGQESSECGPCLDLACLPTAPGRAECSEDQALASLLSGGPSTSMIRFYFI